MDISLHLSTASAERFDSLFQYYSRKYELEQLSLKLAGREFKIYHIRDIDPLLEELIGLGPESPEMRDERLPYWAELWPAAIGLSQFILENSVLCGNQTAIELGCGVGLAGIAAASLGAEVMISDYQKDALALAELNWIINIGRSPQAIRMDWRNLTIQEKFDNVIASDIVYEERFFHPIINNF
ncbi:MAG: 50S ribosomal protein L11 methyltransferase, partial [Calditrichaeota bacterium]|nr:50S ribosomal protein L11 methyltransferase [Calditrichota bacterium]